MKRGTFTNFYVLAFLLFLIFLGASPQKSLSQTVTAIPEQCFNGAVIDLYNYVEPDGGTFAIIPGATPGLSGHTFDPTLAGIGSYTIRWTHSHVGPGHMDLPVDVVGLPTASTAITSSPDKFCVDQGGNIQLAAIGGTGTTLHWYNDFPGGNEVGTGSPLTIPAPVVSTTFYAVWENACGVSLDYNYQVIVYNVSAADMDITGLDSPYCSDDPDDLIQGVPAFGYLTKTFSFTGPVAGFTNHGNGTGTLSPSNLLNGTYNLTYTVTKDNCTHNITEPVTILPPLVVNFSGLISPVCIDWGTQLLTGNFAPAGTFSGPGITNHGNGTATFDPAVAGGGTHTITYTYTDINGCTTTNSQTVVVNLLPSLSFGVLASHYCLGDGVVTVTGSEAPNGYYTINGNPGPLSYFVDNSDGTADFDPTDAGVGTYTIRYFFTDVNSCTNQATRTTQVHPLPVPSLTGPTTICEATTGNVYTTDAGMSNYSWTVSAGGTITAGGGAGNSTVTVTWGTSGPQSVSVNYEDLNGCTASSPTVLNVTVNPLPVVSLNPLSDVCLNDAPFALSGGTPPGGTYTGTGVAAGIFNPSTAGAGTHLITYTYTDANTCSDSDSENITVQNITANMFNLESDYCVLEANETLITDHVGDPLGYFFIAPAPSNPAIFTDNGNGTAIFSPTNCAVADYNVVFTITYTYDNGTCIETDAATTYIYGQPTVSFSGLSSPYCTDHAADLLTGTPANGIFTSTGGGLTDNGNGTALFTPSVAGSASSPYTITYTFTDPSGCFNFDDQTAIVNPIPVATLTSSDADNTICAGASVIFTAGGGNTYQFFKNGVSMQGPGALSTYTTAALVNNDVVYALVSFSATGCDTQTSSITTTVINAPSPTFVSGDNLVCNGDAGLVYETQAGMNNYVWAVVGGTITSGGTATDHTATVTWTSPGARTISVNYQNSNGCSAASATVFNVTVVALPNPNLAVSDDEICAGETGFITISGTQLGVTYQLRLDADDSPVGAAFNGTGGNIIISANPASTTVYNIIAANSSGCFSELIDKPTITVNPLPIAGLVCSDADLEICEGELAGFTASGGDVYEFLLDGLTVQGPGAAAVYSTTTLNTGEAVSAEVTISATGCTAVSIDISLLVNALPNPSLSGDAAVCLGQAGEVYSTEVGMSNYVWAVSGGTVTAGGGPANNSVTVTWNVPGVQSVGVNYENSNGCQASASTQLSVNVSDLPLISYTLSDPVICFGNTATITQSGSQAGVTYQLRLNSDNSLVGSSVAGTGSAINFNVTSASNIIYNVLATNASGCENQITDLSSVLVNALPNAGLTVTGSTICSGETATIVIQGSEFGVSYQLRLDADDSNLGVPLIGTGGDLTYHLAPTTTTIYNILATNGNSCSAELSSKPTVTVNALPDATLLFSNDDICYGETASMILYSTVPGVSYQLRLNSDDSPIGIPQIGNGGNLLFTVAPLVTTTYNVLATNANFCSAEITDKGVVVVNPLPDNTLSVSSPSVCSGETAIITLNNSVAGVVYQLRLDSDNSNVGGAVAGNGSNITFSVTPSTTTLYNILATSSDGCSVELSNKSLVTIYSAPNANLIVDDDEICYGETASIIAHNSQAGVTYQLRLDADNSNIGSSVAGTGGNISFPVTPVSTTVYNIYAYNSNACAVELIDKPTVTVHSLPDHTLTLGDDNICSGETADILLYNSVLGVTYQLRLDSDNSNVGMAQSGNGGILTFHDAPTSTTTYNMFAVNAHGCSIELNDKALVQVYPLANNTLTVSDPTICVGENAVITVSNSETGVSYQLRLDSDNSLIGAAVPGNGGNITFDVAPIITTLFNVLATTANSCDVELANRSLVTVNPSPDNTLMVSSPTICNGETASVVVYSSQVGVSYQLRLDSDNTTVGVPVSGNGGNITFNITPASSTLYNVLATGGNGCSIELNNKSNVTVYPLPDPFLVVDNATICLGETAVISLHNSQSGVSYQLRNDVDDSPVGAAQTGNGGTLSFSVNPVSSSVYNILATTTDACSQELFDKSVVTVLPAPNLALSLSDDAICLGETAQIILSNSALGVSYQLRLNSDNSLVGTAIVGTGFNIQFSVAPAASTVYNVLATNSNGCSGTLIDLSSVTVYPLPAKPVITPDGPTVFCAGGSVNLTSSTALGYLWSTGSTTQTIAVGTSGSFTVTVSDIHACQSPVSDPVVVTVNPLPVVSFTGLSSYYCHDEGTALLTGSPIPVGLSTGVFSGPGITDNGNGTAIFDPVAAGIGGPYSIVYTFTNSSGCSNNHSETTTVNNPPVLTFTGLDSEYCVSNPQVLITGSEAPYGQFSGPGITDNSNGTAWFNPSAAGVGGPFTISYEFTNSDGCHGITQQTTLVYNLPTVSFATLNSEYCVDHATVLLTGNHAPQGSFSGIGVFDNGNGTAIFDPSAAGVGGPYNISYSFTDGNSCANTSTQQTTVYPLPTVSFSGLGTDYCVDAIPVTLVGNHAPQGYFTGPGITDNGNGTATFNPSTAGPGLNKQITYFYTSSHFCLNSQTKNVNIHALPNVSILNLESNYCVNDGEVTISGNPLPSGSTTGFFTGAAITDLGNGTAIFAPNTLIAGNIYPITYTYQDINSCSNTALQDVNIIELPAAPNANNVNVCFGDVVPNLTATGVPGFEIRWYDNNGNLVFTGNSFPTGITAVGVYNFSVAQVHTVTGCESNHKAVTLSIIALPVVTLPPFDDVCIYDFIIWLDMGTPAGGVYSGSPGVLLLPNGTYIFHPEYGGAGIHNITYTYTNPATGCHASVTQTITVHDRPVVDIIDLNSVYCVSGTPVTIHGNHAGAGTFTGPGITNNGNGSALFNPAVAGLGVKNINYYYSDPTTGCHNTKTEPTTVEGPPENVALVNISDQDVCINQGGNITLQAMGGDGSWVNWFVNSCNGPAPDILSANGDSTIITIASPTVSTYYFAQWETECGVSDLCADNYITVTPMPVEPDTAWAAPNIICGDDQDFVSLYIVGGNFGTSLVWTQDSCTGVVIGQTSGGELIIPSPDTTTKYFAHWENICGESVCTESVRVSVIAPAVEVAIANANINNFCANTITELELRAFGGRGDSIVWHYDALGLYPVPLDSIISVNSAQGDTITIVPPTISTTYYPFRTTPCEEVGGNISVDITVFAQPVAPDLAYTIPSTICFGITDSITLVYEGGSGITLDWFAGDCANGVFLGSGNNLKVFPPTVNTSYFAKWSTPCGESSCTTTQLNVYPPTQDPVAIVSDTNNICAGNLSNIQLVVVGGDGDSVVWFADSCNGIPLNPSTFYYQSAKGDTIVIPAPTTDTSFYAYWATLCEVSSCVDINIFVSPLPLAIDTITSSHNNFCSGSVPSITLTAFGGVGDEISWTVGSCDGPVIAITTSNILNIPSPQDTTIYFAKWKTICDSTECKSIQINVPESPVNPTGILIQESLICNNTVDSITMILSGGSGYEAVWFFGEYCGNDTIQPTEMQILSAKGDTIRIARPAQTQVITANWASYQGICGSSDCVSENVFVYEAPEAIYSISGGVECENTLLQFTPNSTAGSGLVTQLLWDFGDGVVVDTNLQTDQFHAYENSGTYTTELIVTNTFGCQDTAWLPVIISNAPTAAFSYTRSCLGEPVQFYDESVSAVDSIAGWFWNFNDPMSINDTSSLQNPQYAFTQPGIYEVILTVTDTSGCIDISTQEVFVSPVPSAYFTLGTASCQGIPVFFNDSSFTQNNQIGTWIWNFGDGTADSVISAPNIPDLWYTYHANGDFTVSLTVIDTSGCYSETFYRYFDVRPNPVANFIYSDTACQTGIIHFFDDSQHEPGTNAVAWQWNFGDDGFAFNQNPVHSYIQTGQIYNVEMIITDQYGCQDTMAAPVEVKPSMQIAFDANTVCSGTETQFIAQLIQPVGDQVAEWKWFFGDNSDTIVQVDTVYHQYSLGGTYYVSLVGVDDGGCETIIINQPVNVNPVPLVDFYIPNASCSDPSIFYDHSVANADSMVLYHFDYGDGTYEFFNSGNYPNPVHHIYPAGNNEYIATISLTNSNGCESVKEYSVARESCITMAFEIGLPACVGQEITFENHSVSNNNEVVIDSVIWRFGDGVVYELAIDDGQLVHHTYNLSGTKTVEMELRASNQFGDFSISASRIIYVNETPVAEFKISENLLCSRDSIHFQDQSWVFNGQIVSWKWNFGDVFVENDTAFIQNPSYWYGFGGNYQPQLLVTSDSGCTQIFSREVTLISSPVNHLFANREFGCGPENEILFRDTAYLESGSIAGYEWIFGFNDTVKTQVDSLWYQLDLGEYTVISRVISDLGCVGTDSLTGFNVYDKPIARFGYYPEDIKITDPQVYFNDQSLGTTAPVEYYHWDFGDLTDTIGLDPVHLYQDTGFFNVVLTILDENGCVDTITHSLYIDPVFAFYMPNAFSPNGNGLNDAFGPVGSYFKDTEYEFRVFSRWGEMLFETKDPAEMWMGDYHFGSKEQVPLGVYSWIIRVEDATGEEHMYKGNVTVVR